MKGLTAARITGAVRNVDGVAVKELTAARITGAVRNGGAHL